MSCASGLILLILETSTQLGLSKGFKKMRNELLSHRERDPKTFKQVNN